MSFGKALKPRRCRQCPKQFSPVNSFQVTCGNIQCAMAEGRKRANKAIAKILKAERQVHKAKLLAVKPRKWWIKKAEAAVNTWIRLRDKDRPCISCPVTEAKWDAGHYRSVGAQPALRFHPLNIHKQCAQCNMKKGGNGVEYGIRLAQRIGAEMVAWLEQEHPPKKYTIPDLQAIEAKYKALSKALG